MISVIMSTYKEEEILLREAIESVLNQTFDNFEYIIILDAPENEMHKEVISSYACKDKRIRFYINEKNIGLTASLNKGIKLSQGEYICRMDADDISLPQRFERQLSCLERYNYDLIGGITQMIDERGNVIYTIKKVPTDVNKIAKALRYGQCVAHPTWFGRKQLFDSLLGYREIPLCEDYDFTLRAILSGFRVSNINETVLQYRMTSNSISRSNLFQQYLYMKFVSKQYSSGKISSIKEAHQYVRNNDNYEKSQKYLRANIVFNDMLKQIEDKKIFSLFKNGIRLLFTSKAYLNKMWRFFMLTLYS